MNYIYKFFILLILLILIIFINFCNNNIVEDNNLLCVNNSITYNTFNNNVLETKSSDLLNELKKLSLKSNYTINERKLLKNTKEMDYKIIELDYLDNWGIIPQIKYNKNYKNSHNIIRNNKQEVLNIIKNTFIENEIDTSSHSIEELRKKILKLESKILSNIVKYLNKNDLILEINLHLIK